MTLLMVVSHNNEDVEALATRALLIRAGIQVDMATFEDTLEIKAAYQTNFIADYFMKEIDFSFYDGLIIPGGKYVSLNVDKDVQIKKLARHFYEQNKYLFAICAGPRFLLQEDLIHEHYTAFPGSEIDQKNGTYLKNEKVVIGDTLITARSAGAVYDFVFAIILKLKGEDALKSFKESIYY